MAEDFRTLLMETDRLVDGDRWFGDIQIGGWFYFSAQAGPFHESRPQTLQGPMGYESFELRLQGVQGVISYGRWGAWEELQNKPWAKLFTTTSPTVLFAPDVPVATCQEIYEDLLAYARTHPLP
ncbi:conserved hypothetical protein [Solidesulfovibrio fructosivorans JJ]]|uniref:Uncharacterized protein n=1 Tax=Solidesulfovibrio fructosivorans JJ] TaxID=596151 RepID=E1JS90_SOLFR|nr:hypothetical protein [Solidesulfovibrio fructosivorans]EFL52859.1 conserved hypothetical protein [Solidesulfovibrio fructosivorans JJ]]